MKTREEVLSHLLHNGYNKKAINKITGFMVAKELKAIDEVVKILKGEGTFEDFFKWYHSCETTPKDSNEEDVKEIEYCPCCVIDSLIEDIVERLSFVVYSSNCDSKLIDRYEKQLAFLMDIGMLEEDEINDED